jgi:hypothetical protein
MNKKFSQSWLVAALSLALGFFSVEGQAQKPVVNRLAVKNPDRVRALIVQNGNAYEEGLRGFWTPLKDYWHEPNEANAAKLRDFLKIGATKWQDTHGTRDLKRISPDTWTIDQALLDRPGNKEIQQLTRP